MEKIKRKRGAYNAEEKFYILDLLDKKVKLLVIFKLLSIFSNMLFLYLQ